MRASQQSGVLDLLTMHCFATAEIPLNEYYEYFGPTYQLDVLPTNMDDLNTREYLEKVKIQTFETLRHSGFAPSVQTQPIPKLDRDDMEIDEDLDDANQRKPRELPIRLAKRRLMMTCSTRTSVRFASYQRCRIRGVG